MAAEQQAGSEPEDARLAFLMRLVEVTGERPEHRVLDRLEGEWDQRVQWQIGAEGAWRHQRGRAVNRWVLGGRVLESCGFDAEGVETTRTYLAFDPSVNDYVNFTMAILSLTYGLERGPFDPLGPALVFEGHEVIPNRRDPIRYHRTYTFVGDDDYTVGITYPDHPDGAFGGMFIEHHRTAP